jgi:hypothetical protein
MSRSAEAGPAHVNASASAGETAMSSVSAAMRATGKGLAGRDHEKRSKGRNK